MKIVINTCFGGFGLSLQAAQAFANRKGKTLFFYKQTKYKHSDGLTEYQRVADDCDDLWAHAHLTDHGEVFDGTCAEGCYYYPEIERHDPDLIAVVEEMGERANGQYAKLKIVDVPDDLEYEISEYDGNEHIAETHRTWS